MADDLKITRHEVPNPGDRIDCEAPGDGWVVSAIESTRQDYITIVWRPASVARVEVEGRTFSDLQELSDALNSFVDQEGTGE